MDNQQPSNNIFYQKPKKGYGYIYKYTSPSKKNYIGQTVNSLSDRAKSVVSGIGYKKCPLFWKAIQKYSFTNFKIEIIKEAPILELNYWEKYYIQKYNALVPKGYNLTNGGDGGKTIDVYVYSAQNGKFIEHYNSLSEASLMTGVPIETISSILSKKSNRRISHNLTFLKEYQEKIDLNILNRNNYIKVYVYKEDGSFYKEFKTISEAAKSLKISEITIKRHLEKSSSSCGFFFRKEKVDKISIIPKKEKKGIKVCQIDPLNYFTVAVYNSLSAAARAVGLASSSSIKRAIERKGKAKGYYWKIVEGSTTMCSENPTESVRDTG